MFTYAYLEKRFTVDFLIITHMFIVSSHLIAVPFMHVSMQTTSD